MADNIRLAGQIWGNKKYFCAYCESEITGFKDKASAAEFRVSGMCQKCQDGIFPILEGG